MFGGVDGLEPVRTILAGAAACLVAGGWLLMEFGMGQDPQIETLVDAQPDLRLRGIRRDLQGLARMAIVERTATAPESGLPRQEGLTPQ